VDSEDMVRRDSNDRRNAEEVQCNDDYEGDIICDDTGLIWTATTRANELDRCNWHCKGQQNDADGMTHANGKWQKWITSCAGCEWSGSMY